MYATDIESKIAVDHHHQTKSEMIDEIISEPGPDPNNTGTLSRKLKSRHVQFMALSGAIGTGLFVSSGQILSLAGPLSAFLAYLITGLNVYAVMQCLGEMATYLPLAGAVPVYAARYVDEALGFTLGWNYWYQLAIGVPIEISAAAIVVDYWPNNISVGAVITIFSVAIILINLFPVHIYGEAEFVFGAIKLTTIIALILLMLIITCGGGPTGHHIGFAYWHNPGAMLPYLEPGSTGRFLAFLKVFIQATFSYGGSEMVVIAAGETDNPRRNVPKAIRRVFWRILIFYVPTTSLVGLCVSPRDPRLLNAISSSLPGAAASPFVIAITNSGIKTLPGIINALSYASTRILYASALRGHAPKILTYSRFGVPYASVAATTLLSCLVYLNVSSNSADVFFWISNLSAVSTLLGWASIGITHLRFRAGLKHHGIDRASLPYQSPLQPYLSYFSVCFCLIIALLNGYDAFFPGHFSARTFIPPYIDIPIFAALFLGYKFWKRSKIVTVAEMDLWTGKREVDLLEGTWQVPVPKNWVEKVWFWIA